VVWFTGHFIVLSMSLFRGSHITLVAHSRMVDISLQAAKLLEAEGIDAEVCTVIQCLYCTCIRVVFVGVVNLVCLFLKSIIFLYHSLKNTRYKE